MLVYRVAAGYGRMSNKWERAHRSMKSPKSQGRGSRYEFRAWTDGAQVREHLESWAQSSATESVHDCYLLCDDPTYNVKVRDGRLKLKQLIGERKGFQLWGRIRKDDFTTIASPFYAVMKSLEGLMPEDHRAVADRLNSALQDSSVSTNAAILAVPVTKKRRLFRLGLIKGEVTQVKVASGNRRSTLTTVAIEGPNIRPLIALRASLGLADEANRPYHLAVGAPKRLS